MTQLPRDFIKKFTKCLYEEEEDIYVLALYSMSADDMEFFAEADRVRIRSIFKVLMEDTRRHSDLLRLIIEMGER